MTTAQESAALIAEIQKRFVKTYGELRTELKFRSPNNRDDISLALDATILLTTALADLEFARSRGDFQRDRADTQCARAEAAESALACPIDMLLFCPACDFQHVDQPQPEKGWSNPPHRSHECQGCGYVWRPADVPTNGVAAIKTVGKVDGSPIPKRGTFREGVEAAATLLEGFAAALKQRMDRYALTDVHPDQGPHDQFLSMAFEIRALHPPTASKPEEKEGA